MRGSAARFWWSIVVTGRLGEMSKLCWRLGSCRAECSVLAMLPLVGFSSVNTERTEGFCWGLRLGVRASYVFLQSLIGSSTVRWMWQIGNERGPRGTTISRN